MEVLRSFIFSALIAFVCGIDTWPKINNDNQHTALGDVASVLTRKYFSPSSNTVVIIERCVHTGMHRVNTRILEHILTNLQETITVQLCNGRSQNQPWKYHIFVVDGVEALENIKWSFSETGFERDFRFLVILSKYTPDYLETIKGIFESCHRFHVFNANVILNHPLLGVCMYKYDLFTNNKCNEVQPYLYFRFNDGLHNLVEVFPQKLMNFWGCPLRITARLNHPFVTFSGNHTNPVFEENWESLSGFEGELMKTLSQRLNFTLILIPIPHSYLLDRVNTTYGCVKDLMQGRADIGMGGFSASHPRRNYLTTSIIFHQTPAVFIVRHGRELDSISRLGFPFNLQVWNQLSICLLCLTLALLLLRLANAHKRDLLIGQPNRSPIFNFLTVFLGYPMTRPPSSTSARYFLTVWLLMTLVIRNAYQGSLFDAFRTDKFLKTPEDYDDLIKWNYKLLGKPYFAGTEVYPKNQTVILYYNDYLRLERLEKLNGQYVAITLFDNFLSYLGHNIQNLTDLRMIKQTVYTYSVVFYFSKHSIYARPFNKYLKDFRYFGLIKHIYFNHCYDYRFLFRIIKNRIYIPQPITLVRMQGAFEIFTVMMALATLVFVMELISVRLEKLQLIINWID